MKENTRDIQERRQFLKMGLQAGCMSSLMAVIASCQHFNSQHEEQNNGGGVIDPVPTGELVAVLTHEGKILKIDKAYLTHPPEKQIGPDQTRKGIPGKKFVMVLDLSKCNNLRKCHDACETAHHLSPEKEWLKVLKMKDNELASPYWQPTMCFHCDHPLCVQVCPVDATYKRSDGIVLIDNERCIGCRFCMVACPYSARVFDWSEPIVPREIADLPYSPESSLPPKLGTVSKCDFCPNYIRRGLLPPCVPACPNGVLYFGDENEDTVTNGSETVRLSELLKDCSGYRFMEDFGTKPRVYYLPPVNRLFPFEDDAYTKNSG